MFVVVYLIALLVLLFHIILFPSNSEFIIKDGLRFLLPVVIPSALCLITVRDIRIVENSAVIISWITAFLVFVYAAAFFLGRFTIDHYNMSFSYGCLLPMLVLYTRRKPIPLIVSIFLFIIVVSIGSRGAAIVFVVFVVLDLFLSRNRFSWVVLLVGAAFVFLLPLFLSYLDSIGINSRTLTLLIEGRIDHTSGRDELYDSFIAILKEHPFLGIGLFGDRIATNGAYCHNLILEIYLDFGLFIGTFILLYGIVALIISYRASRIVNRTLWLIFAFSGIMPFMASSSYLIYNPLAILIGYSVLVVNHYRNIESHSHRIDKQQTAIV